MHIIAFLDGFITPMPWCLTYQAVSNEHIFTSLAQFVPKLGYLVTLFILWLTHASGSAGQQKNKKHRQISFAENQASDLQLSMFEAA